MSESRIKDQNYYLIQGFMINKLKLKGVKLSVYAIIYGFTQDGETEFTGSINYLCDFTGKTSRPTIIKALNELTEEKYIFKREEIINNVKFNRYRVNLAKLKEGSKETLPPVKDFNEDGKESTPEVVKNFNGGSKETLHNNINNNLSSNNIKEIKIKENTEESFELIIYEYSKKFETPLCDEINLLLREWLRIRKAKRIKSTDTAIKYNLNKLDKLAKESKLSVLDYLREVVYCKGWAAFYPINNFGGNDKATTKGVNGIAITEEQNELDKIF